MYHPASSFALIEFIKSSPNDTDDADLLWIEALAAAQSPALTAGHNLYLGYDRASENERFAHMRPRIDQVCSLGWYPPANFPFSGVPKYELCMQMQSRVSSTMLNRV